MNNLLHASNIESSVLELKEEAKISSLIVSYSDLISLLDSLPYISALLDENRDIVYANEVFHNFLETKTIFSIINNPPGNVLECVHQLQSKKPCGHGPACGMCGMHIAIDESIQTKGKVTKECRISRQVNGREVAVDYQVTASTLLINGVFYTMLTMKDISHEKRRRVLESIFFHDILNKVGSLAGLVDILKNSEDHDNSYDIVNTLDYVSHEIVEEIEAQRLLMNAESGELVVDKQNISTLQVLEEVVEQVQHHSTAEGKEIVLNKDSINFSLTTDLLLLKRVLINMLKNALEASTKGEQVEIGIRKQGNVILFWVHNNAVIEPKVKLQIFHRSFSTKGSNRGLGTYSMKLLGEQYLKGRVFFDSLENEGTTFYLGLPIN